jgi:hypothetical protein
MQELLDNEAARARMALIWKRRAVGEYVATARFAAYAERMKLFNVPQGLQDKAVEASEQELEHQAVCLELAHRLGFGDFEFHSEDFSLRPDQEFGPANLLADMVRLGCVVETCNTAQLATALHHITEPEIRLATRKILADEVQHSRLGWAYLEWARANGEGELLAQHVPKMLWEAVGPEMFMDLPPHPEEALLFRMGDPPMQLRRELFVHTITDVILPGLEKHGISTEPARAWLANPTWPGAVMARY